MSYCARVVTFIFKFKKESVHNFVRFSVTSLKGKISQPNSPAFQQLTPLISSTEYFHPANVFVFIKHQTSFLSHSHPHNNDMVNPIPPLSHFVRSSNPRLALFQKSASVWACPRSARRHFSSQGDFFVQR